MNSARRIVLVVVLFAACGAACLGDEVRVAAQPIATIPFSLNGKLVSVRVGVNGSEPLRFTVDTGASASVIDSRVAQRLHLRRSGVLAGHGAGAGPVRFDLFKAVRLSVGAAAYTAPTVYGISLGSTGTEEKEAGLLGYDLFAKYVVKLDYENRVMTLYDPARFHYAGSGIGIPMTLVKHTPHIAVVITVQGLKPQRRELLIDSGSEDSVDDDLIARSTAPKRPVNAGVGLGKRFTAVYGPVEQLEIGPYVLRNLGGVSGGTALLGGEVLGRFTTVFDYSRRVVYFESTSSKKSTQ
jgi:hypothetical protein